MAHLPGSNMHKALGHEIRLDVAILSESDKLRRTTTIGV